VYIKTAVNVYQNGSQTPRNVYQNGSYWGNL